MSSALLHIKAHVRGLRKENLNHRRVVYAPTIAQANDVIELCKYELHWPVEIRRNAQVEKSRCCEVVDRYRLTNRESVLQQFRLETTDACCLVRKSGEEAGLEGGHRTLDDVTAREVAEKLWIAGGRVLSAE